MGDVQLLWDDRSTTEDSFRVERSPNDNLSFAEIANLPAGTQDYLDTGLADGDYFYRTRSALGAEFSSYSNEVSVTVSTGGGPVVAIFDEFAGTLNDRIVGRLPSPTNNGNVWTIAATGAADDNMFINASGQSESDANTSANNSGPMIDSGLADCVIECDLLVSVNTYGVYFRTDNPRWSSGWKIDITSSTVSIKEGNTARSSLSTPIYGRTGTATITLNGSQIDLHYVGANQTGDISYGLAGTGLTTTTHGIYANAAGAVYDNFKVTGL